MTKITRVEIHEFGFDVPNLGNLTGVTGWSNRLCQGAVSRIEKFAVVIITEDGCKGEYVTHWCSTRLPAPAKTLAPKLIGRQAEEREGIFDDMKRELRQFDHMGQGPIDIALGIGQVNS